MNLKMDSMDYYKSLISEEEVIKALIEESKAREGELLKEKTRVRPNLKFFERTVTNLVSCNKRISTKQEEFASREKEKNIGYARVRETPIRKTKSQHDLVREILFANKINFVKETQNGAQANPNSSKTNSLESMETYPKVNFNKISKKMEYSDSEPDESQMKKEEKPLLHALQNQKRKLVNPSIVRDILLGNSVKFVKKNQTSNKIRNTIQKINIIRSSEICGNVGMNQKEMTSGSLLPKNVTESIANSVESRVKAKSSRKRNLSNSSMSSNSSIISLSTTLKSSPSDVISISDSSESSSKVENKIKICKHKKKRKKKVK